MAKLAALVERIDDLTLKERCLLLVAGLSLMFALWHFMLMIPLSLQQQQLEARLPTLQQKLTMLEQQSTAVVEAATTDPDAPLRLQLAGARRQLIEVERAIQAKTGSLVAPGDMAKVLETVLRKFTGLEFVSLQGLGVVPLLDDGQTGQSRADPPALTKGAFRHGLRIEFAGGYLDTLAYLKALEDLPWGFFWDSIELEVTDHPVARGSIVVYTLSLDRGWIGV